MYATLRRDTREWDELSMTEKDWWGLHASPVVLSVLMHCEPEGWQDTFAQVNAMAHAWVRSGVMDQPSPILGS